MISTLLDIKIFASRLPTGTRGGRQVIEKAGKHCKRRSHPRLLNPNTRGAGATLENIARAVVCAEENLKRYCLK
jgi:hypothetical protein